TIIYFTHNACWYCTQVAGFFVRMEEKLGAGSFQVVGINVMAKDQRLVKAYKREVGFPYPMLAGNTSELLKAYRINYVPVLIFVGRDGIVKKVVGHYIMETELEAVILEIVKDGKQSRIPLPP
ncbi:MAG: TlpA disulfide reductase family protein, partial [Nitrospirota bacterium]